MTNGAGQTVYAGNVAIDGRHYTVAAPAAATQLSEYYMNGLKIKSSTGGHWDWEVDASDFTEAQDDVRTSFGNTGIIPSSAATAGTIAIGDGTGWKNLDLRGDFRPDGNLNSTHQLSFGYHVDDYILQSITDSLMSGSNWNSSAPGTLFLNSMGQTQTQALYIQDAWKMAQAWKLIVGGRLENWQAFDGSNYANGSNVVYQNRSFNAISPKISLSYQASEDWDFRGSFGRGTRFPTVGELFANVGLTNLSTGTTPTPAQVMALPAPYNQPTNNPDLLPETVDAWELTAERWLGSGLWRNSLFTEFKQNALISQTDVMTLPGYAINTVQNVDGVRTIGYESVLEMNDLWKRGLDFSGSVTLVNSIITADARNPGLVGTLQPRIPDFRTTLTGTYHINERLLFSVDYRFSGRQHVALYNTATHSYTDPNPDVYGNTVSDYSVVDAKVLYKVGKRWSASLGANNITNCQYFVNPNPYPMRTWFASGKYDL
uniref:Putative TonB-dependent receptor protein n=1 Tax=mine drainage metagenome TaxID=410659 RepID=E6QVG6_9ZZZZ